MPADGNMLWAWQVQEPDGSWSMVGVLVAGTHSPLIHRSQALIMRLESRAQEHAKETGQPLRLAQFTLTAAESWEAL